MACVDFKDIERRQARYWNLDGLSELALGFLFVLAGGQALITVALLGSLFQMPYSIVGPTLALIAWCVAPWALRKVRERITYPRVGYAEWQRKRRGGWQGMVPVLVAWVTLVLYFRLVARWPSVEFLVAPGVALLMAAALLVMWIRVRDHHFLWLTVVSLGCGVWLYRIKVAWEGAFSVFLWLGIAMVVLGCARFQHFLRTTRKPGETAA